MSWRELVGGRHDQYIYIYDFMYKIYVYIRKHHKLNLFFSNLPHFHGLSLPILPTLPHMVLCSTLLYSSEERLAMLKT